MAEWKHLVLLCNVSMFCGAHCALISIQTPLSTLTLLMFFFFIQHKLQRVSTMCNSCTAVPQSLQLLQKEKGWMQHSLKNLTEKNPLFP